MVGSIDGYEEWENMFVGVNSRK